jgi:hypothetical protein
MDEWSRFELGGHLFVAFLPSSDDEDQVFTLVVSKDGRELRREAIPLLHRPIFGPDAGDVAALNARVEAVIRELGLEDGGPPNGDAA